VLDPGRRVSARVLLRHHGFRILGPLEVFAGDGSLQIGGRRQRTVLAVLLLNANRITSTDAIIDAVWGDDPPTTARRSIHVYVSRLKKVFGEGRIGSVDPGYRLRVDAGELDADSRDRYKSQHEKPALWLLRTDGGYSTVSMCGGHDLPSLLHLPERPIEALSEEGAAAGLHRRCNPARQLAALRKIQRPKRRATWFSAPGGQRGGDRTGKRVGRNGRSA